MSSARFPRLRTTLGLLFVFSLTACGGGGTGGGAVPPAASGTPATLPLTVVSQNGSSITLTGTIDNVMSATEFDIQGGHGVGSLHIFTTSSTVVNGPKLFVGENVEVTGSGSVSSSVTATQVSQISSTPIPSTSPSSAPVSTPPPPSTATPAPLGSPIPMPTGVITATGQIVYVSSSKIEVQAGAGCGYVNVYPSSNTVYFNGAPAVGQYGAFTGPGTRCNFVKPTAASVSSSQWTSATYTGTVASATSYGFTLSTGSATLPVAINSSTVVFGGTLAVGSSVTVTALGTATTGLAATQIAVAPPPTPAPVVATPTPGPISMKHVLNFAYIYGYAGTPTTVPISSMAPWVNWTMTDEAHAAAMRSAGIKVQVYANFWRNYTSDNPNVGYTDLEPGGAHAAAEALDCSGTPVYDTAYGGGYEADARSSAALGHAQVVTNYRLNEYAPNYDALFSDDTGGVFGITLPCNYSESAYDAAINALHSSLGVPMWVNALGGAPNPANAVDLVQPSNVIGAACEQCYDSNGSSGDFIQTGTTWQNVENAEIGVIAQHKIFWDYPRATGSASAETGMRIYAYASFLLSYDANYAMFHEALSTPSGFPVMPETALVPMNPLTTATSVLGYQAPGGAFFREFADCYYQGSFVSSCAVAVNPTASAVPVPSTSYTHSLVLSGNGVLDGGTVAFNGPAVTQLAAGSAVILFP